ncbi:MAG: dTMP kinase [Chloroflexi bacterium]|nr:dTMP kinase [Chloroflexota bacterium]
MAPGSHPGLFITLEGGEGSGKSTQARALVARLRAEGPTVCATEEPMGTPLGRAIKGLFEREAPSRSREPGSDEVIVSDWAELFLFEAARAQHVRDVIRPALERKEIVICDRFADSTTAYQGYGRGLDLQEVENCNSIATGGLLPDLTLLFDIDPEIGLKRAVKAAQSGDALRKASDSIGEETLDFHERVREGFLAIARANPDRFVVIDAAQPMAAVEKSVRDAADGLLARSTLR